MWTEFYIGRGFLFFSFFLLKFRTRAQASATRLFHGLSWLFFFFLFFGINYLEMERGNRLSQSTLSVFIHRVLLNLPRIYIYVDESLCEK